MCPHYVGPRQIHKQMRQAATSLENFDKSPAPLAAAFAVGSALFPPLGVSSATSLGYRALRIVKVSLLFAPLSPQRRPRWGGTAASSSG
jgi:hypothetical protein